DYGRRPRILAPRLPLLAVHGIVQPDRPAGDRPAAGAVRRHAGAGRDWIPDLGSARCALRRRGDAVPPGRAAREGAAVVRSHATARWVIGIRSRLTPLRIVPIFDSRRPLQGAPEPPDLRMGGTATSTVALARN